MSGEPIRTAVLGFGRAGNMHHALQTATTPGFTLSAIVTANPERVRQARATFPEARILASPDEVWADASSYDLVIIATPNATHVPLARQAIAHGIAVVIDKPIATTAESARQLIGEAQQAGVPLTIFQNRRWDGDYLTVKALLDRSALGEVYDFESRFTWWEPNPPATWKAQASVRDGGGAVYDLGPHLIDQALRLFGPVASWYAELDTRRPGGAADDNSLVLLTHENGVRSRLWTSCVSAQAGPRFRISGSAGSFTKFGLDPQEDQAGSGMSPADSRFGVDSEERWGVLGIDGDTERIPTERGSYATFFELLRDALWGEGELPVDPAESVEALELIEKICGVHPTSAAETTTER